MNVTEKVATFFFDETINDRGSGPMEVENFVLVSPSDGHEHVSWHRSRIEVRPRMPCDDAGTCAQPHPPGVSAGGFELSGRTCLSRRRFTAHFQVPHGVRVTSARLKIAGRRFRVHAGKRLLTAVVDLRRLRKGTYKLTLRARTSRGQPLTASRRYRTCVARHRVP